MNFRQLTSFLSATLLGLSSAGAYIPEHLGGEGTQTQKSALQVESAILLREDGTPRCWIGENPSGYLTDEKLDEFYRQGLDIDSAGLNALRECDKSDELYAISTLGSEEISYGAVTPSNVKMLLSVAAIGVAGGCLITGIANSADQSNKKYIKAVAPMAIGLIGVVTVLGSVASAFFLASSDLAFLAGSFGFFPSVIPGSLICHRQENK